MLIALRLLDGLAPARLKLVDLLAAESRLSEYLVIVRAENGSRAENFRGRGIQDGRAAAAPCALSVCRHGQIGDALAEEHLPGSFRLAIGDTTLTASDIHTPILYSDSVQTVPYRLVAYNEPKGIIISPDSIATIQTVEDTLLTALPDYLFAADTTATVRSGDTATVNLRMHRLLMPITLTLNFSEPAEVADVRGTLSGLISSIHLPDGTPVETEVGTRSEADATSSKALMAYEILPDNDGIRLLVRTFGIDREERQQLDVIITLADGRVLELHVDMTEALRDFGHLEPIALENSIDTAKPDPEPEPDPEPTPDPEPEPEEPPYRPPHRPKVPIDVSATISNWETIEEDNIDIY